MRNTTGFDRLQPLIATNAMVYVNDEIALLDLTGFGQEGIGPFAAALAAL